MAKISTELLEIKSLAGLLPAFEFERLLEHDATGAVYKACHRSLGRDVSIKILPCESGGDPSFRNSFHTKAKAMARLTHPSLIRVYDFGDLDGHLYTVMEYVPGESLLECARGLAVHPVQAVGIILSACEGMAHAHENGVFHGDIKPANIFLTKKCEPKIGNFGHPGRSRNDIGGFVTETPEYLAPELVEQPGNGGPQADVFALGVILRELLTGIPAGAGDAAKQVVSNPTLAAICRKATHPDPAMRYAGVRALADELSLWMKAGSSATAARKLQVAAIQPTSAKRRRTPACPSPSFVGPRPKLARIDKRHPKGNRSLVKFCFIVSLLLCGGYLIRGVYQTGDRPAARQQVERAPFPTHSENSDAETGDRSAISRELSAAASGSAR